MSHKQGFRVELAPDGDQAVLLGRHAGLSRAVENFALETVKAALDQRNAEKTYGIPDEELTKVPWSAPALESAWRAAHPTRFPVVPRGQAVLPHTEGGVSGPCGRVQELLRIPLRQAQRPEDRVPVVA